MLLIAFLMLSSCNVKQFLEKDQHILSNNAVKVRDISTRSTRKALQTELSSLYKQKPLGDFIIFKSKSGAWFYYKSVNNKDAGRFNKWLYRSFGKRPTLFDPFQTDLTVKNMKQYLINKGYRYPSVFYEKDFHGDDKGYADITYYANPGKLYVLDTVNFRCLDTTIQYLVSDTKEQSFLKKGVPLSVNLYEQERVRITKLLNNKGYARFTPNYIAQLDADSIDTGLDERGNRKVNINLVIQLPNDKPSHQKYYVGDVRIYPNYDARFDLPTDIDTFYNGKFYYNSKKKFEIKVSTLDNAIGIIPNTLYSRETEDKVIKQVNALGYYKFSRVNTNIEECDTTILQYNLLLTPGKKMAIDPGAEINYSNISGNSGSFGRLGAALDFGFVNRNFLGGAERFSSSLSGGVDIGLFSSNSTNSGLSSDIRFDNVLSIPKFVNPSKTFKYLNRWNIVKDNFYNELKDNATTEINLSYIFSDRLALNLYRLQQFNLGYKYVLKRKNGLERFTFNPVGVELILSQLDGLFRENANLRTKRSLDPQLLTGLVFRTFTFEKSVPPKSIGGNTVQYSLLLEQSGSELWLIDKLRGGSKTPLRVNDSLGFSKFWKAEFDIRWNNIDSRLSQDGKSRGLAARLAVGIASNFGDAPYVPYSRQFFVGGPNSIRGWLARGVGPGTFKDNSQLNKTLPFQSGDIKFEFNSEYRFPIFLFFKGAIFLDAGNVWAIKSDDAETVFSKFWYDQMAISSGFGLRIDVKYALIRLDFGFKLRNPYKDENNNNWIPVSNYSWKNNVNINFALGMPF